MEDDNLECLDCHKKDSSVTMTTTSDRRDFKHFPRCPECWEEREARAQQTMSRYPEAFTGPDPFDSCWW